MANISIVDGFGLDADLEIRDDSPLAKAKLTKLLSTAKELVDDFAKPIDQADEKSFELGGTFTSPNLLNNDVSCLTAGGGAKCVLSIHKAADKLLFPDDGFSEVIPILSGETWLGVDFDFTGTATAGTTANGVGVSLAAASEMSCTSYTLFTAGAEPLPTLRDGCVTAFGNYSLTTNPESIRSQLAGTVNETHAKGSITASVSLEPPFSLNALASANLPFNETVSIQPTVTVKLASSLQITGEFLVRSFKVSNDLIRLGVYKKQGTTLSVSFTAAAGISGDVGTDDVLTSLLNSALPGVNVTAAGVAGGDVKPLNDAIKSALNRGLSAQVNATCSAAETDEAAVLYDVQLNTGDTTATDHAVGLALHGDWTELGTLPNVKCHRNIAVETADKKRAVSVNLFGFYSATSVNEYLDSLTVLVDDSGQISISDKLNASRISASVSPYAADTNRLRRALVEDFLCTATYAVVFGKRQLNLSATQSYLDYRQAMSPGDMRENVRLGYALSLIPSGALDATVNATPSFDHASVSVTVQYDTAALMNVFYDDPNTQAPRSLSELEKFGRNVMCSLLDPSDDTDAVQIAILRDDAAWVQMDQIGNTALFKTIPSLSHLGTTQLGAVCADWVSIAWWAGALSEIAPALSVTTKALANAPVDDPRGNAVFMKARERLANELGKAIRNIDAAFVHGWGIAVMFALSEGRGSAQMDIDWGGKNHHFGTSY